MKRKNYIVFFAVTALLIFMSCVSQGTENTETETVQGIETQEPSDDIEFLNGTIWEYETQIGDFTAWRCISIDNGRAVYYMRMGNAIDTDPNTASVYVKGNIIIFTKDDGSSHKGEIIGDTILLDGVDIYTKLP